MNVLLKPTLIVFLVLSATYYITNKIFKVNYSEKDVVVVDSIQVNDSITIRNAFVVLGKNYKGFIEGTVFSLAEHRYKDRGIVEYYYLRFHPEWFNEHILPRIKTKLDQGERLSAELVEKAKEAHRDNFQYCCHVSGYPIVKEGLLFTRISLIGLADKITVAGELNR